ncbi:MAG TPA: hypothetical protein VGR71_18480, partial [Nitrospira sp.]|nr:hypothetical protein [Nitrospira sp.]
IVDLKARMIEVGREFGEAFNKLARTDDFIETEEREELFAALMAIPTDAGSGISEWLAEGLDQIREW